MINKKKLQTIKLIFFDFDGVFTDNSVFITQNGIESVRCCRSDGLGLSRLKSVQVNAFIISTEKNSVVTARAKKLNIPCKQGIADKKAAILQICDEQRVLPEHTMFVGNDINDIAAFKSVGFPVAVADAYPEVYPYVLFRTEKSGGYGAVREICDLIFEANISI